MNKQETLNHYMNEVEKVKRGETNAFDVGTDLKEFMDGLDSLYEEIKPFIIDEREKYSHKEDVIRNGYKIYVGGRDYYSYDEDATYDLLNEKLKSRKKLIKKATDRGEDIVDPETSEIIEPVDKKHKSWPVLKYVGDNQL